MSYKSYQKAPSRPFDHLYDQNYLCNNSKLKRLNHQALLITAPLHIIPCYHLMFCDQQKNFHFIQKNPLPIERVQSESKCTSTCFTNKNLMSNAAINYDESSGGIKIAEDVCKDKTFRSIKCQTKYREIEVQTDPYLPDAKLREGENCVPEIACINNITTQPSLKDIHIIERARFRRHWEDNLSSLSIEERVQQLKIIEWENYLMQEKEMNVLQEERLQQVFDILDERINATKMINDEILANTNRRNFYEGEKMKRKMREKLNRKLRKTAKFYGQIEGDELIIKQGLNSLKVNPCPNVKTVEESTKINFFLPEGGDGKWRDIFEAIHKRKNPEKCKINEIKCVKEKEIKETPLSKYDSSKYDLKDKKEQNTILIQRTLKGRVNQTEIVMQMNINLSEIRKYQAIYPIKCLELLPKQRPETPLHIRDSTKVIKFKIPKQEMSESTSKVIDHVISKSKQLHNQKLLKEAEEMRRIRRKILEKQQKATALKENRRIEIKNELEKLYDEMTIEIIERITPIAIELIAQQDAEKFIIQKAKEMDESSVISSNELEIDDEVEKAVNEVLIPHVVKILSEKDEEMHALIAAHDAFDDFLDEMKEN